jgi:hypothetical protein
LDSGVVTEKTFFIKINVTTKLNVEQIFSNILAFEDVTLSLNDSIIFSDFNNALNRLYTTLITRS